MASPSRGRVRVGRVPQGRRRREYHHVLLPDSKLVSSGIPRIEFGLLRTGVSFQGVAVCTAGRRQFSRIGLQGWLHGEPCIGTPSPVGEHTSSRMETGYRPIAGRGTRHASRFSTLLTFPGSHRFAPALLAHRSSHYLRRRCRHHARCVNIDHSAVARGGA